MPKTKYIVQESKQYGNFITSKENRGTNPGNLKNIIDSMKKYGWIPAFPMLVSEDAGAYTIIDGQHRMVAAQTLGIPVLFVVVEKDHIEVRDINCAQRAWTVTDFLSSYVNQNTRDYVELADYIKKTHIGLTAAITMFIGNTQSGSNALAQFKSGDFKIKDRETPATVAHILGALKDRCPFVMERQFICALLQVMKVPGFNSMKFMTKCESHIEILKKSPTLRDYINVIESVYNFHTATDSRLAIAFEASKLAVDRKLRRSKGE